MSRRRTITVTLTEQQYYALSGAVAFRHEDLQNEIDLGSSEALTGSRVLGNAWDKIQDAWSQRPEPKTRQAVELVPTAYAGVQKARLGERVVGVVSERDDGRYDWNTTSGSHMGYADNPEEARALIEKALR